MMPIFCQIILDIQRDLCPVDHYGGLERQELQHGGLPSPPPHRKISAFGAQPVFSLFPIDWRGIVTVIILTIYKLYKCTKRMMYLQKNCLLESRIETALKQFYGQTTTNGEQQTILQYNR